MKFSVSGIILLFALSALFCFGGLFSLSFASEAKTLKGRSVERPFNVLMIVQETIRPDHLGCYGYKRAVSPFIDKLAKEGVLFENAFSQSSQSLISAASLFTGLYPPSHGVTDAAKKLPGSIPTLAGELKKAGYSTAAFTGGFFLNKNFGLDSGFDVYQDSKDFGMLADVYPEAGKWLQKNKAGKFFLLLHSYDAHAPYRAPADFLSKFNSGYTGVLSGKVLDYNLSDRIQGRALYEDFRHKRKTADLTKADIDYVVSQYDGALNYADYYTGKVLALLREYGLTEKTIVVFLGTAGEALMEHEEIISSFHGGLYEEGIKIPLIISVPGMPALRVTQPVQLVDIMPTVLALTGHAGNKDMQGKSLQAELSGQSHADESRIVYAQTLSLETSSPYFGIRQYPWKLLFKDGSYQLFNLHQDPAEKKDLSMTDPQQLKTQTDKLNKFINKLPRRKIAYETKPLAVVSERMKALGYWWMERPRVKDWENKKK